MYCDFYQLRERPFNVTADPKFLYLNARYREALAALHYGISQRKGFVTLIGEAGTGKTTLLKKLLDDLDSSTRTVFIFNTNVTFDEILEYIFGEFDLPVHNGKRLYMLQRLNTFLLEELRNGRNVALLIDEAQDLDFSVLEDLRLLSNLETAKEKILQIILSGQPELGQKLGNPGLRQLRQRVAVNCRLLPLTREEITEYIQSRLTAAGSTDPKLFTRDAEDRIFEISTGIPRLVNIVCDNALVIGYALGKKRIGADVVNEAAADLLSVDGRQPAVEEVESAPRVPSEAAVPRVRNMSQLGVVAVVVGAILIGLLSVGRSLLRRDGAPASPPVASRPAFEVIQPGSRDRDAGPSAMGKGSAGEAGRAPAAPGGAAEVGVDPGGSAMPDAAADRVPPAANRDVWEDEPLAGAAAQAADEPAKAPAPVAAADEGEGGAIEAPEPHPGGVDALDDSSAKEASQWHALAAPPAVPPPAVVPERNLGSIQHEPEHAPQKAPEVSAAIAPAAARDERMTLALPKSQTLRVEAGDSISQIATRTYGQASPTILDLMKIANPSILDIDVISVGQEIRLPQLDEGFVILQQSNASFALLLLSTPLPHRANEIESALRQRGFAARVASADFGAGRTVSRVLIGDLASRDEALEIGKRLRQLFREDERIAAMAR